MTNQKKNTNLSKRIGRFFECYALFSFLSISIFFIVFMKIDPNINYQSQYIINEINQEISALIYVILIAIYGGNFIVAISYAIDESITLPNLIKDIGVNLVGSSIALIIFTVIYRDYLGWK